jgi:hypothetical protein
MHDGMIRDKQYGIENDGLVIFRNLGFTFSRTERDFVAVPQARNLIIGGRSLGCPGVIEVYIAGPHWQKGQGAAARLKSIFLGRPPNNCISSPS